MACCSPLRVAHFLASQGGWSTWPGPTLRSLSSRREVFPESPNMVLLKDMFHFALLIATGCNRPFRDHASFFLGLSDKSMKKEKFQNLHEEDTGSTTGYSRGTGPIYRRKPENNNTKQS